jgi:hypothetical protein
MEPDRIEVLQNQILRVVVPQFFDRPDDMGAAGNAANAGKAGCSALGSCLGSLGRILADIFSDAEKTSQATLALCGLLGLGNIITSMIAFSSMHGIRVDLVEYAGDTGQETRAEDALRNARYFLSMQFGLFAIFFSTLVWGVLVILDRFKFSVGKIFILLATMYTVLMYLTHGVSVETISKPTLENVQKDFAIWCNADQYEHLCAFDLAAETAKYEAAYVFAYMGIVGLVFYVCLMVYFYRTDLRAEITDKRATQSSSDRYRDDGPDTEMGGGSPRSPNSPPPAAPTTTRLTKTRRRRGPRSSSPRTATDRRRPRPRGRTRSISRPAAAAVAPEPPRRRRIRSSKIDVRVSGGIATFYSWSRECIIELS